ncbi:hypothetical protein CGRA01v4_07777 [Colletotrichum graminicola]|nr:hypothetical protein CGRA01v4_07777 [Colletotrichum graminicola]
MIGRRPFGTHAALRELQAHPETPPTRVQSSGSYEALVMQYCIVRTQVWLTVLDFLGPFWS